MSTYITMSLEGLKKIPESPLGILQSSSVAKFFVSFHKNHKLTI